ncbi:L-histidine N(alpha)-methyltransferase [Hyphomicrobium methylovorum]|uniref:L-histidine N(alpha)-methyltransferase n=1 Tax=Hyphomicrobium methylovorum TaxID=84 RepID=UPI0015E64373|nr:L-histidine N(alpha)-methyltransferase [Hyphomicrobium methylovorum]MBA2126548.1 L-histidine N(alpha)-methyltransferase [Hyphomicrobium methylovorum]
MNESLSADYREDARGEYDTAFAKSVHAGLSKTQKTLPCRYLYDARGSRLFERITGLAEYYPTRTEAAILRANAEEICAPIGENELLVEFGSGSSVKTEILLDRIASRVAYVPIDVSRSALEDARARLARRYRTLDVRPIVADFSQPVSLPPDLRSRRKTGFFPGSTIGNLAPDDAIELLKTFRHSLGENGRLIVGVDLKKDPAVLVSAYDDASGVTAAFNRNLLKRINRELGGSFDEDGFSHRAIYDANRGRIEMHLVSTRRQDALVAGRRFRFESGETIHTENSYKYSVEQFRDAAVKAGWSPRGLWTDDAEMFSIHELILG